MVDDHFWKFRSMLTSSARGEDGRVPKGLEMLTHFIQLPYSSRAIIKTSGEHLFVVGFTFPPDREEYECTSDF